MTTTALTSELEAVNTILEAIDEAPVNSLAQTGLYPLEKAKGILNEVSRAVQSKGYTFNTEDDFPLTRDGSNQIAIPGNVLTFDAEARTDMDLVQRGLRLYDRKAHSYTLQDNVKGTAVVLLGWDELPQQARHFITVRAARTAQGRSSVSESTYRYTEQDVMDAEALLNEAESAVGDHNMLRDSFSVASVLQGRGDLWA